MLAKITKIQLAKEADLEVDRVLDRKTLAKDHAKERIYNFLLVKICLVLERSQREQAKLLLEGRVGLDIQSQAQVKDHH